MVGGKEMSLSSTGIVTGTDVLSLSEWSTIGEEVVLSLLEGTEE
jgi:hypothetical protein